MYAHVDEIVVTEARETHSGLAKPELFFESNAAAFEPRRCIDTGADLFARGPGEDCVPTPPGQALPRRAIAAAAAAAARREANHVSNSNTHAQRRSIDQGSIRPSNKCA